ncbi:class I SAM-dependent methyltransferase [Microcystis aeruginosa]|nr:class I SAM-dependent methyltransferase [Microcystis aeruginosa]
MTINPLLKYFSFSQVLVDFKFESPVVQNKPKIGFLSLTVNGTCQPTFMGVSRLKNYTSEDILAMDYNQLISVVRETNRPPGGTNSIFKIAQRSFLKPESNVLEIGTSTGFTAIELARLIGCQIKAIDINEISLEEGKRRAEQLGVSHLITFEQCDATQTGYAAESFEMVFCGNVTSLIAKREDALTEYQRVLKPNGFVAAIPMYYIKEPSNKLVQDVSEAIQVEIKPLKRDYWIDFFDRKPLQLYWAQDYYFEWIEDKKVEQFITVILKRPHLQELSQETQEVLFERYRQFMYLFRDNLSHMGYTIMLLRKEKVQVDPELFISHVVTTSG